MIKIIIHEYVTFLHEGELERDWEGEREGERERKRERDIERGKREIDSESKRV